MQSRYENVSAATTEFLNGDPTIPFEKVVICDVDTHATPNEHPLAAIQHIKNKGGSFIQIPHDSKPMNEFNDPTLFPKMYPILFPYGLGSFKDCRHARFVGFKAHVTHLVSLSDKCFQEHHSFLFTAFNMIQRRTVLLHTNLKVKQSNFDSIIAHFQNVTAESIHHLSQQLTQNPCVFPSNDDSRQVHALMQEVNVISSHVQGFSASKVAMQNEI